MVVTKIGASAARYGRGNGGDPLLLHQNLAVVANATVT